MTNTPSSSSSTAWPFVDGPMDLLIDCQSNSSTATVGCIMSTVVGFGSAYLLPFYTTFGFLTNFLSAYVFLAHTKRLTRQNIYLSALALADNCTLLSMAWVWMFPAKGLPYASNGRIYYFVMNVSETACKLHRFACMFASSLSCNFLLLTTLDRLLAIYLPFRFRRIPLRTAWILSSGTVIFSAVSMLPFLIMVGHSPQGDGKILCWLTHSSPGTFVLHLYSSLLASCGLVQVVLMVLGNVALVWRLKRSRHLRKALTPGVQHHQHHHLHQPHTSNSPIMSPKPTALPPPPPPQSHLSRSEINSAVTLLVLSSMFIVCSLPQTGGWTMGFFLQYYTKDTHRIRLSYNINDLGWLLFFLQQSVNFCIYMLRMPTFYCGVVQLWRSCYRAVFCCRCAEESGIVNTSLEMRDPRPIGSSTFRMSPVVKDRSCAGSSNMSTTFQN